MLLTIGWLIGTALALVSIAIWLYLAGQTKNKLKTAQDALQRQKDISSEIAKIEGEPFVSPDDTLDKL